MNPVAVRAGAWTHCPALALRLGQPQPVLPFYAMMNRNLRLLWVFVYELPDPVLAQANLELEAWLATGNVQAPQWHEFALDDIAAAHEAVEGGALGKVLVSVGGGT